MQTLLFFVTSIFKKFVALLFVLQVEGRRLLLPFVVRRLLQQTDLRCGEMDYKQDPSPLLMSALKAYLGMTLLILWLMQLN